MGGWRRRRWVALGLRRPVRTPASRPPAPCRAARCRAAGGCCCHWRPGAHPGASAAHRAAAASRSARGRRATARDPVLIPPTWQRLAANAHADVRCLSTVGWLCFAKNFFFTISCRDKHGGLNASDHSHVHVALGQGANPLQGIRIWKRLGR